jgi:hypothetical protein
MTVYQWRDGGTGGVSAQAAGEEIQRIRDRDGFCEPEILVDESRPEEAPLHPAFDWDDPVAAERWRTHQARNLIRSIQVIEEDREPEIAFISVKTESGRGYVDTRTIAETPDLHQAAVAEAMASLRGWTRRYQHINELADVIAAVEVAIDAAEREVAAPKKARKAPAARAVAARP